MTFGISAGTLLAAGAAVAGGAIAANGSKSAAKTQADAANQANQTNLDIFNKQTELQEPFRQNGLAATNRLSFLLGLPQPQGGQPQGAPSGTDQGGQASQGNPFAPHPEIPQAQAQEPVTEQNFNAQAYLAANPDVAQFIQAHPGSATPWEHYNQHGRDEGRSLGLPTQQPQQAPATQQPQGPVGQFGQPAPSAQPNDQTGFGALNQQFNQADFQADGAPKFAPFTQTPNLPTFDQQAPQVQDYGQYEDVPAFNADMMRDDPGYQFRMDQGLKGVQSSAAAKGGLFSGAAGKALQNYGQNLASQEYQKSFDRYQTTRGNKLQDYLTNQNTAQQNYTNQRGAYDTNFNQFQVDRTNAVNDNKDALNVYSLNRANGLQDYQSAYDRFQTNRGNVINPLLSLMGAGQQATNQQSSAAQNFGQQSAAAVTAAGNARAAGQVGSANAVNGAIGTGVNAFQQNQLMNLLLQRSPSGVGVPPNPYA